MQVWAQVALVIVGALIAGFNGLILYVLSDLKGWLMRLNTRFDSHVSDRSIHK